VQVILSVQCKVGYHYRPFVVSSLDAILSFRIQTVVTDNSASTVDKMCVHVKVSTHPAMLMEEQC